MSWKPWKHTTTFTVTLLSTFYFRVFPVFSARRKTCPSLGRTPLIRAPIGFCTKIRLFKAQFEGEAAIF